MTQSAVFSDQDLSAYLDGELPAEKARILGAALDHDPRLRARLDALSTSSQPFVAAMASALSNAPAMPDLPAAPQAKRPSIWPIAITGAAAGIVLTLGLTWIAAPIPSAGWQDVVANYQSLYVTETLERVDLTKEAQQADLVRISAELGFDLTDLPSVDGLTYKRVQQLGFNGKPLAQLTFLTADGGPVALCVLHTDAATSDGISSAVLSGLDTYSWTDNGFGILLVGPRGQEGLEEAAEAFRRALSSQDA